MKTNFKNVLIIVIVLVLIVGGIIFLLTRNSESKDNNNQSNSGSTNVVDNNDEEQTTILNGKVLVVYFSHTGTTEEVAKYLNEIVEGDLIELIPVEAYPSGYSAALEPAKQEQRENARPELKTKIENFDNYDTIYLGYPIWWGTVPMVINTFLESYNFNGKTVIPFATSGGTGISQSITDIKSEIPNANVLDGLLVRDNSDIEPWLKRIGMK